MDAISLAVCPLEMVRVHDGAVVASSIGTGFLWEYSGTSYLVTNWHNVTGINPDTNKMLSGFIPTHIRVGLKIRDQVHHQFVGSQFFEFPLYTDEKPNWFEHVLGKRIDIAAIQLDIKKIDRLVTKPLNQLSFDDDLESYVSMDCFIVGFPRGLKGRGHTPIWKKGSIATEPSIGYDDLPLFLVDTATREGMSGSPVIGRHSGLSGLVDGKVISSTKIGTTQIMLGVYSGRIGADELGVQLGRVWKINVVNEILASQSLAKPLI